jgi:uncharacterized coiled-coil DUF342 family protein
LARDEAVSARNEAKAIYNETRALLDEIKKKELNIQSLQKISESDSEATAANAAQAEAFLNEADEIYKKITTLSVEIEDKLSEIKTTLQEARAHANTVDKSASRSSDASTDDSKVRNPATKASLVSRSVSPANRESENRGEKTLFFLS